MASYEVIEYKPRSFAYGDDYISIYVTPIWLARAFGARDRTYAFRGSATVWHHYPSGERAGTLWESRICALVAAERNKREIPLSKTSVF